MNQGFDENIIEKPKVSIVVPVYNVEKYLSLCLDSLINQTLKDIEIIVINDGSTDNSLKIIEEYAQKDFRIKVVNQENAGPSKARNEGLKIAVGEYITFVDSDDWVDNDFIEKLYYASKNNDCDISVASIIRKRPISQKYRIHYIEEKIFTTLSEKIQVCKIPVCCYVWCKLYKKEILHDHMFESGKYFEDVLWLPEIIKRANKIITVPNINYYYRVNNNSIVKKIPSAKKQEDSYFAKKYIKKFFEENNLLLANKHKTITKQIKYFLNIPVLKVKEYENYEKFYFLGLILVFRKPINQQKYRNVRRFFFINFLDSHINIELFRKIRISIKLKSQFDYEEVQIIGVNNENKNNPQLIVSLTSYKGRINTVHQTINTLLMQSLKPDRLVLWLADEEFKNREKDLPNELLQLCNYGLEIRWCENLKSYKKLIPALREFPNDVIVTADDDLYYQKDWLQSLYESYLQNPKDIHTRRATYIKATSDTIDIYSHYANDKYAACFNHQLMGGAGTLYPPNTLHKDVLNTDLIQTLVPTHDDIYFWVMAILADTKIRLVKSKDSSIYQREETKNTGLCKINNSNTEGMHPHTAFARIFEKYPEVVDKLKS